MYNLIEGAMGVNIVPERLLRGLLLGEPMRTRALAGFGRMKIPSLEEIYFMM